MKYSLNGSMDRYKARLVFKDSYRYTVHSISRMFSRLHDLIFRFSFQLMFQHDLKNTLQSPWNKFQVILLGKEHRMQDQGKLRFKTETAAFMVRQFDKFVMHAGFNKCYLNHSMFIHCTTSG